MSNLVPFSISLGVVMSVAVNGYSYDATKERNQYVESNSAIYKWDYAFPDTSSLFQAIQNSGFQKLDEGSNTSLFYVIIRDNTKLRVVVVPKEGGRFNGTNLSVTDEKEGGGAFSDFEYLPILCTDVWGPSAGTDPVPHNEMRAVELLAWSTKVSDLLKGPILITFKGKSASNSTASFSTKVAWK